MAFQEDVASLKNHLDDITSIGQLKTMLIRRGLILYVILSSNGFTCMKWNVSMSQFSGVLQLRMQIRLTNISDENLAFETRYEEPIYLDQSDPISQRELFEMLKQGIKTCIKRL